MHKRLKAVNLQPMTAAREVDYTDQEDNRRAYNTRSAKTFPSVKTAAPKRSPRKRSKRKKPVSSNEFQVPPTVSSRQSEGPFINGFSSSDDASSDDGMKSDSDNEKKYKLSKKTKALLTDGIPTINKPVTKAKTLSTEDIDSLYEDVPPWFAPIAKERFVDIIRYLERQNERIAQRKASREYKFLEAVSGLLVTNVEDFLQPDAKSLYKMYDESLLRAVKAMYDRTTVWKTPVAPEEEVKKKAPSARDDETAATMEEEERKEEEEETVTEGTVTEESLMGGPTITELVEGQFPMTNAKKSGAPPRGIPERTMTTEEILLQYLADKNLIMAFLETYYDTRNMNDYITFLSSANQFGHVSPVIISATQLAIAKLNSNFSQLRGTKLDHYIHDDIVLPFFAQEVAANIVTNTNAKENAGFFARNMKVWIAKSNETRRWENYWFFNGCVFDGNAVKFVGSDHRVTKSYQRSYGMSGLALPPAYGSY